MPRAPRILVACTGSVASIKLPVLLTALRSAVPAAPLRVIATTPALHFFARHEIEASGVQVFTDADEWSAWSKLSDPVLHIQLRNWADLIVIAPLDANTLAKLANGLCDNLLTCTLRASPPTLPVLICPAMNTAMYSHPFTAKHLSILREELGYLVVDPVEKMLACGDIGIGGMAEVPSIVNAVVGVLEKVELNGVDGVEDGLGNGLLGTVEQVGNGTV